MVSLNNKSGFFYLSLDDCGITFYVELLCTVGDDNKGITLKSTITSKEKMSVEEVGSGLDDHLLLNCGILCINGSELWPPIRAVERDATVLLEPGRPWKKTIQLSQNEQAAGNFAAFSEIFASSSGFRFKTTQV